ncbi:hypothetical protein [Lysobacter gummosus]|uniref:hypothetical protein n=1 Tax=Lysobacter gummosus TaxID=262324 RepID=UPI00363B4DF2
MGEGKRRRTPVADGARPPALRKRSAVTREGEKDAGRRCRKPRAGPRRAKEAAGSARQGITRLIQA